MENTSAAVPKDVHEQIMSLLAAEEGDEQHDKVEDSEGAKESPEPTDEPEPEAEAEEQDQPEEEGEEEESEEEPEAEPEMYRVKVDGEEVTVTKDELLKGYSRLQDYTRKTQRLAEERKTLDSERQKAQANEATLREKLARYTQRLEALEAHLDAAEGEPDWEEIKAKSPDDYPRQFADWQREQARRQRIKQERENAEAELLEEKQKQFGAFIAKQQELLREALPEWKNEDTMKTHQRSIMDYARSIGYSVEELSNLYDARAVLLMDKAMRYDQLQKKAAPVKEKLAKTPVLKPGAKAPAKPKADEMDRAKARLKKSGKITDAAKLFYELLGDT